MVNSKRIGGNPVWVNYSHRKNWRDRKGHSAAMIADDPNRGTYRWPPCVLDQILLVISVLDARAHGFLWLDIFVD